jgi:hypothetical protein
MLMCVPGGGLPLPGACVDQRWTAGDCPGVQASGGKARAASASNGLRSKGGRVVCLAWRGVHALVHQSRGGACPAAGESWRR